jgi:sporulation protein YlmC with PRC-barrel domain
MKITPNYYRTLAVMCCASIGGLLSPTDALAKASRTAKSSPERRGEAVRVTRASNFIGVDVLSTDGRKVGDIADYYFNMSTAPHLAYVEIMTGGFLEFGGTRRAVPASAVTMTSDNARINMSSEQYWNAPVLPENSRRYLSDSQNRQRISQFFSQAVRTQAATGGREPRSGQEQTSKAQPSGDAQSRPGAMTGRQGDEKEMNLVSFNELRNSEAYSTDDRRRGYIMDAWVNVNDNRAPYLEITSTFEPFRTNFDRRYAIPMTKLAQAREYYGYTVNTTADELNKAEWVSETEGVKMLEEGRIGNMVLRVRVPE